MEFDEIQKIWDSQNNQPLYVINENALHNRILFKKQQGLHITNVSELLWIIGNATAAVTIVGVNLSRQDGSIFMYALSAWTISIAAYMLICRNRRIQASGRFDRSLQGDLDHAISVATYQVRLSHFGRWNILPIAILVMLTFWEEGQSPWWIVVLVIFSILTSYGGGWEHGIYKARKRELHVLQNKLQNETA